MKIRLDYLDMNSYNTSHLNILKFPDKRNRQTNKKQLQLYTRNSMAIL